MRSRTKRNGSRIVWYILTILMILFIFLQSMMNADVSHNESAGLTSVVNSWLSTIGINFQLANGFLRKFAHFFEYAVLGGFTACVAWTYVHTPKKHIFKMMFVCLATAVADEFIQLYSPGRAGLITDVVLDFSGALSGILIMLLLFFIYRKIRKI